MGLFFLQLHDLRLGSRLSKDQKQWAFIQFSLNACWSKSPIYKVTHNGDQRKAQINTCSSIYLQKQYLN